MEETEEAMGATGTTGETEVDGPDGRRYPMKGGWSP